MAKAVAVGEKSVILAFKGVGCDIVPVADAEGFQRAIARLARTPDAEIVLVTESMAASAPQALKDFRAAAAGILLVIPSHEGGRGFSFEEMRRSVELALGVDVLGKE